MGLLDFRPDEWRGLLGSPIGRLPQGQISAPLFVPPAPGVPAPDERRNTTASPFEKAMGPMVESLAAKLAAAQTRAMTPEAADHGLSERQKLSPLQKALSPITSYPETYLRMNQEARDQISHGLNQLSQPEINQAENPGNGSEFDAVAPHDLSNVAKGAANAALGVLGFVGSPANAAYRSIISQPIEDVTGIPREYTEFAGQLATPLIGPRKIPGKPDITPPRAGPHAQFGVPPERQALQELPTELPKPAGPATEIASPTAGRSEMTPSGREAPLFEGAMPELADRYPKTGSFIEKTDSTTGKRYQAKQYSQEELELEAHRQAAQEDIDAGNFIPWFDAAKRYYADPTAHPPIVDTRNITAVRPSTQAKHEAIARSAEARQRILDAYQRGREQEENARYWAAAGQLENEFIKEYGADQGRKLFKQWFTDPMGAMTAGAKPKANLMMAHYANYLKVKGANMPTAAYEIPFPAGGAYGIPNMKRYQNMLKESSGLTPATPKGYNFSYELLGGDGLAIDRRISRLFHPDMDAPPHGTYGHYQGALADLAKEHEVDPRYFRDMVWAGAGDAQHALTGHESLVKPLITEINETIERTHRITGMPRAEIVRRGLVRREIPLFGLGGIIAAKQLSTDDDGNQTSPDNGM